MNFHNSLEIYHSNFDRYSARFITRNFALSETENNAYPDHEYHVYTDGSKTSSGVGLGAIIYNNGIVEETFAERLCDTASVFEAEMTAINLTAELLTKGKTRNANIVIFSDSLSSIQALERTKFKSALVANTMFKLCSLARNNAVALQWVRAHVGLDVDSGGDIRGVGGDIRCGLGVV